MLCGGSWELLLWCWIIFYGMWLASVIKLLCIKTHFLSLFDVSIIIFHSSWCGLLPLLFQGELFGAHQAILGSECDIANILGNGTFWPWLFVNKAVSFSMSIFLRIGSCWIHIKLRLIFQYRRTDTLLREQGKREEAAVSSLSDWNWLNHQF